MSGRSSRRVPKRITWTGTLRIIMTPSHLLHSRRARKDSAGLSPDRLGLIGLTEYLKTLPAAGRRRRLARPQGGHKDADRRTFAQPFGLDGLDRALKDSAGLRPTVWAPQGTTGHLKTLPAAGRRRRLAQPFRLDGLDMALKDRNHPTGLHEDTSCISIEFIKRQEDRRRMEVPSRCRRDRGRGEARRRRRMEVPSVGKDS